MNHEIEALKKRIIVLERQLKQERQSIILVENAKDRYEKIYRSMFEKLSEQQELLNRKNSDLEKLTVNLSLKNNELNNEISERKELEKALNKSIQEKDILMKEILHRTKNNMHMIKSFLYLQLKDKEDPFFHKTMKEMENRISSMQLVQQKLYQSQDMIEFNINEYIIDLADSILGNSVTPGKSIDLHYAVDPVPVTADIAIPCGLIINELITNSLKYAFPGQRDGSIWISFGIDNGMAHFSYRDDGIGFLHPDKPNESMGFLIIKTLISQLHGKFRLTGDSGMQCEASFPW